MRIHNLKPLLMLAFRFDFIDELETDYIDWYERYHYECEMDKEMNIYMRCNDLFYWGCGDREKLEDSHIDLIADTCFELYSIKNSEPNKSRHRRHKATKDITSLICCRIRKMRPQGAIYEYVPPELVELYDACGPEREGPSFLGNTSRRVFDEKALEEKIANRELQSDLHKYKLLKERFDK